ncbi:hypothetical protein PN498_11210 [Oscillatoria sp. CS-180]|uniref:hypothetical protein n=1 Tax=Oscillatoria sp. CS-180 TaxID=3021720 RepID=UPI0023313239|nr:hypothetical protein [Oscillatoria sp. CS-180]MDB9526560.1 hypothetical protein [Oscillatoria sp. CS-180]
MKPTRWLVLAFLGLSLFGVACGTAEPEAVDETEPIEEVEGEELDEDLEEDMEEADE